VLRDALTHDALDPVGIYFGTRSGQLFGSRDEGKSWEKITDGLPAIVCVRVALFEDAGTLSGQVSRARARSSAISSRPKSQTASGMKSKSRSKKKR